MCYVQVLEQYLDAFRSFKNEIAFKLSETVTPHERYPFVLLM